uniref:FIP-RBD domain-containing protein n=1 Tax=Rhabditophanes sp. KR3021 TaxID=114890 RepID=A0AC35TN80_9BILA
MDSNNANHNKSTVNSLFITPAIGRPMKIPVKVYAAPTKQSSKSESFNEGDGKKKYNGSYLNYSLSDNFKMEKKHFKGSSGVLGAATLPRKGILKRPSNLSRERSSDDTALLGNNSISVMTRSLPGRLAEQGKKLGFEENGKLERNSGSKSQFGSKSMKLSWSEKNHVAIFGDTSDDNTTETETDNILWDLKKKSTLSLQPIETEILSSEESGTDREDDEDLIDVKERESSLESTVSETGTIQSLKIEGETSNLPSVPKNFSLSSSNLISSIDSKIPTFKASSKPPVVPPLNGLTEQKEEDNLSMGSSGSSVIAGKWWFGKDTRYQLHCEKKGCAHKTCSSESEPYLTPTQRMTQEIMQLKKENRQVTMYSKDKDRQLEQLRGRLKEIESLMASSPKFGNQKEIMDKRENELNEMFKREKNELIEKHEIRVRQLIQETVDSRTEMMKKAQQLDNLKSLKENMVDVEVMTDPNEWDSIMGIKRHPSLRQNMSPSYPHDPISPKSGLELSQSKNELNSSTPSMMSESFYQDTITQLTAYQNEAVVWRTKAAQLEIIIKDQMMKAGQMEVNLVNRLETLQFENDRLVDIIKGAEEEEQVEDNMESLTVSAITLNTPIISGMDRRMSLSPSPARSGVLAAAAMVIGADCRSHSCVEYKKRMLEEVNSGQDKIELYHTKLEQVETDLNKATELISKLNTELATSNENYTKQGLCLEEKKAENNAAEMTVIRLHSEKENLKQAITYLEERLQVYQFTILENDIVIADEDTSSWRKGYIDPRYSVNFSKRVQTDLTSEDMLKNEDQFMSLTDKLSELEHEFASKNVNMRDRFQDIESNLILKAKLVESLSKQLEQSAKMVQEDDKNRQNERELFGRRIEDLGRVAEKVPALEMEIERLRTEKSIVEIKLKDSQNLYDEGLSESLAGTMNKIKQQENYWHEKVSGYENQKANLQNDLEKLRKQHDSYKLKSQVEKADLEARLTSSIEHTNEIFKQINKQTHEKEVQAVPLKVSKYVACKPNFRSKETDIQHGDLYNEVEEKSKSLLAELSITKKQVQVLQEKLFERETRVNNNSTQMTPINSLPRMSNMSGDSTSDQDKMISIISCPPVFTLTVDNASSKDSESNEGEKKVIDLEDKNFDLIARIKTLEEEKQELVEREKERIQRLAAEFDNLRTELDEEIKKYEKEKKHLKEKIVVLEKYKLENIELNKKLVQWKKTDQLVIKKNKMDNIKHLGKSHELLSVQIPSNTLSVSNQTLNTPTFVITGSENDLSNDPKPTLANELARSASAVHVGAQQVSTEIQQLRNKNMILEKELCIIKNLLEKNIKRTLSKASSTAGKSDYSIPEFNNLSNELDEVCNELNRFMEQITEEGTSEVPDVKNATKIVNNWMSKNKNNADVVKDSSGDNEIVKCLGEQLDKVTKDLHEACNELELFRSENKNDRKLSATERESKGFMRSFSAKGVKNKNTFADAELSGWKEKTGVMFRELHRLRGEFMKVDEERKELQYELQILKGELQLERASSKLIKEKLAKPPKNINTDANNLQDGLSKSGVSVYFSTNDNASLARVNTFADSNHSLRKRIVSEGESADFVSCYSLNDLNDFDSQSSCCDGSTQTLNNFNPKGAPQGKTINTKDGLKKINNFEVGSMDRLLIKRKSLDYKSNKHKVESELTILREALSKQSAKMKARILELENELEKAKGSEFEIGMIKSKITMQREESKMYEKKIRELEEERQNMYLVMFKKGQEAAAHEIIENHQLDQMTEDRIVLRFLHDAFYYYLLNKGDSREHLQAILTMLNFTAHQKDEIAKKRRMKTIHEKDGNYAIISVVNRLNNEAYKLATDSMHCYAHVWNYTYIVISMEDEKELALKCTQPDIMFVRHCFLAEYLEKHPEIDVFLFVDADTLVMNPYHKLEDFAPRGKEEFLMYERFFNYEIACGSFLAKNSQYSRDFLREFADFLYQCPKSMFGSDNAAIQALLMNKYNKGRLVEEQKVCMTVWNRSVDWNDIWDFEACSRHVLNKLSESPAASDLLVYDDGRLVITKKMSTRRWIRDGSLTNSMFCRDDFTFHGYKGNLSSMPFVGLVEFEFSEERCKTMPLPMLWNLKKENMMTCAERNVMLQNTVNNVAREFLRDLNDSGYLAKFPSK